MYVFVYLFIGCYFCCCSVWNLHWQKGVLTVGALEGTWITWQIVVLEYDVSFSLGKTILIECYDCYKRNKLMILCLPKLAVLFPLNHLGMIVGGCCWAGFKKAQGGSNCGHPTGTHTHTHPCTHTRTDCERTQGVELKRNEAWSNRVLPRLMADGALCQEDATAKVESNLGICMDAVGCMLVC